MAEGEILGSKCMWRSNPDRISNPVGQVRLCTRVREIRDREGFQIIFKSDAFINDANVLTLLLRRPMSVAMPSSISKLPSATQKDLQRRLAITPKTAGLLIRVGYTDYSLLRDASPNTVIAKLTALPDIPAKNADWFRRPLRRMVWLGTQEHPEQMAAKTAHFSYWTIKGLTTKGIWQEDFDDLTGDEINVRMMAAKLP